MRIFGEASFRRQNKKMQWLLLSAAIIVVGLAAATVLWTQNHHTEAASKNTQPVTKEAETDDVVKAVKKLYILPSSEKPTVAAIVDASKLQGQNFFKDAQDGDYLLIYSQIKIAIIYRKSVNKLVNVGPINPNSDAGNTQNTGQ